MTTFQLSERAAIADILEAVAKDGLPGPRDLDAALDAIQSVLFDAEPTVAVAIGAALDRWCAADPDITYNDLIAALDDMKDTLVSFALSQTVGGGEGTDA